MATQDREAVFARKLLTLREERYDKFGHELFDEYAWEMLLALFIADAEGRRLSSSEAISESNASDTIGRRWLAHLRHVGYVVGGGDGDGELDTPITLSARTLDEMETFLRRARHELEQG